MLIAVIYMLAFGVAYLSFVWIPIENLIARVIVADLMATVVIFIASTLFKNSSIYDPYWSVAPMIMILVFIDSLNTLNVFVVLAIWTWGLRLTLNWVYTFKSLHHQDWRYDHYKTQSGSWWPLVNFFGIHLMPTIVVITVMIPAFLAVQSGQEATPLTFVGFLIALVAVVIQYRADHQMHQHQKQQQRHTLKDGLWRLSRHPNYFAEILFWFAIFIMMMSVYPLWLAMLGPLINLTMFVIISIPLMEKRQKARKSDYASYQESTSMLIPWPPKQAQKTREA